MQCIGQYSAPLLFNWTWSALGQSCSIYFSKTWVLVLRISIHGFDFLHWNNLSFWIAWNRSSSLKLKHLFLPTNSDELPCYLESLRMPKFPYQQYWWTFFSCTEIPNKKTQKVLLLHITLTSKTDKEKTKPEFGLMSIMFMGMSLCKRIYILCTNLCLVEQAI